MKLLVAAAILLFAAPLSQGAQADAPSSSGPTEALSETPAPQLVSSERLLSEKQRARDAGILIPQQYAAFVTQFRASLEALMQRLPRTPANTGLHAQILARLDDSEREAALIGLAQALEENPNSPELLRAQGQIFYEQRDFPAAAEAARHAWESSAHKDKAAWALLKMSEGRISSGDSADASAKPNPAPQPSSLDWTIPQNNDISPQAMGHIEQAIASRQQGNIEAAWSSAQAAMNADPTSTAVQNFYELVKGARAQTLETRSFIQQAVQALGAGHGEEAVGWAHKAYERDPSEETRVVLEDVRRRSAGLSASAPTGAPAPTGRVPLLPLLAAGGAGLTALGLYKVAGSRGSASSEDGLNPSPEVSPEQERRNYNSIAYVAIPALVFALVYGGPPAWRAAAPTVTALLRGGPKPLPAPSLQAERSLQSATQSLQGSVPQASGGVSALETAIATRASPLLNAARAQIDARKFTEYVLNPLSEDGQHKARVFQSALGYTRENYQELIAQIRTGILSKPAIKGTLDGYGERYTVDVMVTGPKGQAIVRTGWIFEPGNEVPRLTTAFVKK